MNPAEIPNAEVVTAQTVYPVWHFGPDIYLSGNLATSYASASSQIDRSRFESVADGVDGDADACREPVRLKVAPKPTCPMHV